MQGCRRFIMSLAVLAAIAATSATGDARAVVIESIDPTAAASATSTMTFQDSSGLQLRCRHDITIPPAAFTGTASVTIDAANSVYSNCRDPILSRCGPRLSARWTIRASTTSSATWRLDSPLILQCTNSLILWFTCVFFMREGQTLPATFANPVAPSTRGMLSNRMPNQLDYVIDSGANCPGGNPGTRGYFSIVESLATENLRFR